MAMFIDFSVPCRKKQKCGELEQELAAVKAQAVLDAARWREEVSLKQAHVAMLLAADKGREADFMSQRVKDLQVRHSSHIKKN